MLLDLLRTSLHRAITTPTLDSIGGFSFARVPKDLARRLNVTLGQPLCSREQLAARRAAETRLDALRKGRVSREVTAAARVAAPVVVYFEKERNARERARVEDLLNARSIAYRLLDVTSDEATMTFVTRKAGCKEDDLPIVFVGETAIGDYRALVDADVSGALETALYG